jgi:cysteine synthase
MATAAHRFDAFQVGQTPFVDGRRYCPPSHAEIVFKLEKYNQFGSIKDRAALHIIKSARNSGDLVPGGTIIESSSGNLGVALAAIGCALNHAVIIIVDPKTPEATVNRIRGYGGMVIVESRQDEEGNYHRSRITRARLLNAQTPGSYWVNQTSNPLNSEAHYLSLGPEITAHFDSHVDCCVMSTSSGGHLAGVSRYLRERSPKTEIVAVDIEGSCIFGGAGRQYRTPGMGLAWKPTILSDTHVDSIFRVNDADTFSMSHFLANRGLLVGPSSGAVALVCCRLGIEDRPRRILGILPDGGESYADSAFSSQWIAAAGITLYSEQKLADRLKCLTPLPGSHSI